MRRPADVLFDAALKLAVTYDMADDGRISRAVSPRMLAEALAGYRAASRRLHLSIVIRAEALRRAAESRAVSASESRHDEPAPDPDVCAPTVGSPTHGTRA